MHVFTGVLWLRIGRTPCERVAAVLGWLGVGSLVLGCWWSCLVEISMLVREQQVSVLGQPPHCTRVLWQELEARNAELERRLHLAEQTLAETLAEREKVQNEVTKVAEIMDVKIFELSEIRQGLAKLLESN